MGDVQIIEEMKGKIEEMKRSLCESLLVFMTVEGKVAKGWQSMAARGGWALSASFSKNQFRWRYL